MRSFLTTLSLAAVLVAGAAASPSLFASEPQHLSGPTMGRGMTRGGGMMGMMGGSAGMAQGCAKMMQRGMGGGSGRPNEQWRDDSSTPEEKG